ncbi:hypothetical protein RAB80_017356 [Fusarium oxysporum f. sp. vasinfectum]|nr:hypothetical protein RAB80_017356 [Fusarium oxysporum f. sp. vasinfectum]
MERGDINLLEADGSRLGFLCVATTGKVDLNRVRWCLEDILHVGIRVYGSVTRGDRNPEGLVLNWVHTFVEHDSASTVQELEARLTEILQSSRGGCCQMVRYEEYVDWGDGVPSGLWIQSRLQYVEHQEDAVLFGTHDNVSGEDTTRWYLV